MSAAYAIGWFIAILISIAAIFHLVGMRTMVAFFPEGWRAWQLPAQLASLAVFAAIVLNHPFK
jgi:hypothetical protein